MTPEALAEVERLLSALRKKLTAKADVIADAKGDVRIRAAKKGNGYQIDVNVSI